MQEEQAQPGQEQATDEQAPQGGAAPAEEQAADTHDTADKPDEAPGGGEAAV